MNFARDMLLCVQAMAEKPQILAKILGNPAAIQDFASCVGWTAESVEYERAGVYRELADLLRPYAKSANTILDICSGSCPLEREFGSDLEGKRVVCVEANDWTAEKATEGLAEKNLSHEIVGLDGPDEARTTVTIINAALFASREKLSALMPNGADISIFTLAGTSPKLAVTDHRVVFDEYMADEGKRQLANMTVDGMEAATYHTKKGGLLLRADRIVVNNGCMSDFIVQTMRRKIEGITQGFWTLEKSVPLESFVKEKTEERMLAHILRRTSESYAKSYYDTMRTFVPVLDYA